MEKETSSGRLRKPPESYISARLNGAKPPPGSQRLRNIKRMQDKHKASHFSLNYLLHVAFGAIFEAFSNNVIL